MHGEDGAHKRDAEDLITYDELNGRWRTAEVAVAETSFIFLHRPMFICAAGANLLARAHSFC